MMNAKDIMRRLREEAKAKKALSSRNVGESSSIHAASMCSSPPLSVSTQSRQSSPLPTLESQDPSLLNWEQQQQQQQQQMWQNESLFERKITIEGGMGRGRGHVICLLEDPLGTFAGGNGATLWDCSLALTRFLAEHYTNDYFVMEPRGENSSATVANNSREINVLELGAGLGLVGIALATMGANVVATERALALPLLTKNVEYNQGVITSSNKSYGIRNANDASCGAIEVTELIWGLETTMAFLNERDRRSQPVFDIVVGSDLIFPSNVNAYPLLVDSLLVLLRHSLGDHDHVNHDNGPQPLELWLSHEPRRPEVEQKFWSLLEDRGIRAKRLTTEDDCFGKLPSNHPKDILILKLSLKDNTWGNDCIDI